ncbi:MAG: glycosyltransferase [Synergistaceae bacterium]|nr:glycosyltransferase [Synergistaceae bacterium]
MNKSDEKLTLVISGINIFDGGPLAIFYDCLNALFSSGIHKRYKVILFVHRKKLFEQYKDLCMIHELPKSRKNYLFRLYYEYLYFQRYSYDYLRQNGYTIDVWLSLHDVTPRVKAKRVYTYCHNPSPFIEPKLSSIKYQVKDYLFPLLYKYLYRINIHKATGIIVQEDWIRKEFIRMYGVNVNKIIVARPSIDVSGLEVSDEMSAKNGMVTFFYPAYSRHFKNHETLIKAVEILNSRDIATPYRVLLTLDGSESKLASDLKKRYCRVENICWVGILSRTEVFSVYKVTDCLVFPSKMETWGLPISEFKLTGRPMIVSDLPYAHETVGDYDKIAFFDADSAEKLANIMKELIEGNLSSFHKHCAKIPEEPYVASWVELLDMIAE